MDSLNRALRLYGRLDEDLKPDTDYILRINNSKYRLFLCSPILLSIDYGKGFYSGEKSLILEEVNIMGGNNLFLGWMFLGAVVLLILIQISMLTLYINKISGDEDYYDPNKLTY